MNLNKVSYTYKIVKVSIIEYFHKLYLSHSLNLSSMGQSTCQWIFLGIRGIMFSSELTPEILEKQKKILGMLRSQFLCLSKSLLIQLVQKNKQIQGLMKLLASSKNAR